MKGFTLIELMIMIAIVSILWSIVSAEVSLTEIGGQQQQQFAPAGEDNKPQ